jgi:nitrite reductase/ring-hydroxylating ferredoxin subunit
MKRFILLAFFMSLLSCSDNIDNNQFLPNVNVDVTIDLNLPQFINLQVAGGFAFASGGIRGLVIYNNGIGFVAFDRACPHLELQSCSVMTVESLFMVCPCDGERFQLIDGAPENGDIQQSARFYNVTRSGDILRIRS